jgi:hypothetical protein
LMEQSTGRSQGDTTATATCVHGGEPTLSALRVIWEDT